MVRRCGYGLSTRQLEQPARLLDAAAVIEGAHWVVPPRGRRADCDRLSGTCGAGSDRGVCRTGCGGARRWLLAITSPGSAACGLARGIAGAAWRRPEGCVAYRASAGAASARSGTGHGAGRASGDACLAGFGAGAARRAARAGSLWADAAIFRICIVNTAWTLTRYWMLARRLCSRCRGVPCVAYCLAGRRSGSQDRDVSETTVGLAGAEHAKHSRVAGRFVSTDVGMDAIQRPVATVTGRPA